MLQISYPEGMLESLSVLDGTLHPLQRGFLQTPQRIQKMREKTAFSELPKQPRKHTSHRPGMAGASYTLLSAPWTEECLRKITSARRALAMDHSSGLGEKPGRAVMA